MLITDAKMDVTPLTKSYIHVPHKVPLVGKTVGQFFIEIATKHPDKEMYSFYADDERKTYRQMLHESQQFSNSLLKIGIKKGDRIGIWGDNHYEWLLSYLGAMQIGVITVHMRIDFPLPVQKQIIQKLGIKMLVLMRSPFDLCDRASQIIPEMLTNSADCLNCKSIPELKYVINAGINKYRGTYSLEDFMEMGNELSKEQVQKAGDEVDLDDDLVIFFTSAPKFALIMSLGGSTAQLGALGPIVSTTTTVIIGPTFDGETLANIIQKERITSTLMLIHHINDILNLPNINDYDFSSCQKCIAGGSTIPRSLRERAKKIVDDLQLVYAGSEGFSARQRSLNPQESLNDAAYFPFWGQELKIIDEDERVVPINTTGEICFRSSCLFRCYWGDEAKTNDAKKLNGWYLTGDLGILDENGFLKIVGRKAERIIKEGVNIAPGNLEKVLDQHPAVNNVMVVGVPDERTSEEVCACIRLHSSTTVTADEVIEFCKGKVSDFLLPKYVIFWNEAFPTTETGKFARKEIANQARKHLGL